MIPVDFLLARIQEDEVLAQNAFTYLTVDCGREYTLWTTSRGYEHNLLRGPTALFQRQWPPERVLAECQAKREILALLCDMPDDENDIMPVVLAALLLPYQTHPDYQVEWALA